MIAVICRRRCVEHDRGPTERKAIMNRMALLAALVVTVVWTGNATAQPMSPYAGQQQRAIKALSDQEIAELLEGRGMGLAKAGELNSYPGPLHVLQLADQLALSDAQRAATTSLQAEMRDQAVPIGQQIIEAERTLDRAFADRRIEPATLRSQLDAIAILQGHLRAVHLETHLAQRSLLTREQISRYDALRGYGDNRTPQDSHRHGG